MDKVNLVLAIKNQWQLNIETEQEYVKKTSAILNDLEPKMADKSVIAISGYFGNQSLKNKVNATWASILESINNTPFTIGEVIIWKRNIEVKSDREDRISEIATPIFILCRKEEYKTYHLNVEETKVKGNAHYYTPIPNLIQTSGSTIEEDYDQIEKEIIKLYNHPNGKVYRLFEEEDNGNK